MMLRIKGLKNIYVILKNGVHLSIFFCFVGCCFFQYFIYFIYFHILYSPKFCCYYIRFIYCFGYKTTIVDSFRKLIIWTFYFRVDFTFTNRHVNIVFRWISITNLPHGTRWYHSVYSVSLTIMDPPRKFLVTSWRFYKTNKYIYKYISNTF